MIANMNYNQMLNIANPNPHVNQNNNIHEDHHHSFHSYVTNKQKCHSMLQNSYLNQLTSIHQFKVEEISPKQTRNRTKFTDEQIAKLESYFRLSSYRGVEEREWIASKLNITSKQVTVWFQNRRVKLKKKLKKEEKECISNQRTLYTVPFSNILAKSNPTLSDGATPSPESIQSVQTKPSPIHKMSPTNLMSPTHQMSPFYHMSPSNQLSPSNQMSPQNQSHQSPTGDWQTDIDPNLVTGFDQNSNYDPEAFFNEHLSHLIHMLWS